MANADRPNGFTPIRHLTGGTIRMEEMPIVKETAAAIYSGDLCLLNATGYVNVAGAATGAAIIGVFGGCSYRNAAGEQIYSKYWPAAQATLNDEDAVAYIYSDPNIVFSVQTSGTAALADNGKWMDMEDGGGSTSTGRSAQEANENATSTVVLRQLGLVKKPDNAWGTNGEIEVTIALHARTAAAGAAV